MMVQMNDTQQTGEGSEGLHFGSSSQRDRLSREGQMAEEPVSGLLAYDRAFISWSQSWLFYTLRCDTPDIPQAQGLVFTTRVCKLQSLPLHTFTLGGSALEEQEESETEKQTAHQWITRRLLRVYALPPGAAAERRRREVLVGLFLLAIVNLPVIANPT